MAESEPVRGAKKRLDRTDRRIVELLQRDGRMTNQALSKHVALSARACLDRVRRLEKSGVIAGYMALVEPRRLGGQLTIVVEVTLKDQTQATHARFENRMRNTPEVIECFLVSGSCDYVLRLACRDLDHYRELTNAWTDEPTLGVAKIASKPELQTVKAFRGYPLA
jgi:Lrp/AsnC family leucine-responsive transcriptional regulator